MMKEYENYMDNYDEFKNDDCEDVTPAKKKSKHKAGRSENNSARRRQKIAYHKAVKRMRDLEGVAAYKPSKKDEDVIRGMLRSHQLPMNSFEHTCGCSIGNQRRVISAEQQLKESLRQEDYDMI